MINITDTEYEILNFIKEKDPEGTKGVSNMFIHGSLKHGLTPRTIRFALRKLTVKKMLKEKEFYFYLNPNIFQEEMVVRETNKKSPPPKLTITRIVYAINKYYKIFGDYPLPKQVHDLFQKIYNTKVDPQTFTRTMRKLGENGRLERIPLNGNKFKYKPKGDNWSDRPLNKFMGGD